MMSVGEGEGGEEFNSEGKDMDYLDEDVVNRKES